MNMLNFNKLRFIVFEIFDNSQLFLTDPRIKSVLHKGNAFLLLPSIVHNRLQLPAPVRDRFRILLLYAIPSVAQ